MRRCKQLQAALSSVSAQLVEAQMAETGLRRQNAGVAELSQVCVGVSNVGVDLGVHVWVWVWVQRY